MKKLLLVATILEMALLAACASTGSRGGTYREVSLTITNPAPARLTPPDYQAGAAVTDPAYLSARADYHFTIGETYSFEGQSARAVEEYKATLIYDPKSVHVRLRLAAEYVRLGMVTEAIEQGEFAVKTDPTNVEAHMLLGGIYSGLKLFGPARDQFQAILDQDPGHGEAAVYLGALLAEERKYDEAIAYFTKLTTNAKFEETEKAWYYIGRVRAEQGNAHVGDAKRAFDKALTLKPEYPDAALALASLQKSNHEEAAAAQTLAGYQDKFGPTREMSRALSQYYLEKGEYDHALEQLEFVDGFERDNLNVKIQIALVLIERKRYTQAAQRLEDVLLQAPESDKVHYYLGAVYEEIGKPEQAIANYRALRADSTYYADAVIHGAHLIEVGGHLDKAVDFVNNAVKSAPDQPQLYAFLATLLDEQKEYAAGVRMLEDAVTRFPDNVQLRFFLGSMQDHVGNLAASIGEMQKVIAQDADNVQALNYLAFTYAEQGRNLKEAAEYIDHALTLQPRDAYILDTAGWVRFKRGDIDEAIKYLEAAVQAKPDEAIMNEHLGDAYLRSQMWQKAQALYQRALGLEQNQARHRLLRDKLANIQSQTTRLPASVGH